MIVSLLTALALAEIQPSGDVTCADLEAIEAVSEATEMSLVACLEHEDLTVFLTRERVGNAIAGQILRIFGKNPYHPEGPDDVIYVDRAGQGPIDLEWQGARSPLVIGDFNGDGQAALAVGAFIEEPTLVVYTLTDDPYEFLGRTFFFHAEGFEPTSFLASRGVTRFTLGEPIIVCDGWGRLRHYSSEYVTQYRLSYDSGHQEPACEAG